MGGFNKDRDHALVDLYIFIGNHNEGILHDCKDSESAFCLATKSSATSYVHVQTPTMRGPRSFIEALPEGVSWETGWNRNGSSIN